MRESISEILADLGVSHSRDENSVPTGKHKLFFADRYIGSFDAHEVGDLIREHLVIPTQLAYRLKEKREDTGERR